MFSLYNIEPAVLKGVSDPFGYNLAKVRPGTFQGRGDFLE